MNSSKERNTDGEGEGTMELQYYTLDKIPDFTMAKYSAQESGDVEDILKQHSIFYRQLHRRGLMSGETYTLLYQ